MCSSYYDFLQKNNKFVKYFFGLSECHFDTFVKVPRRPVYTKPYFGGIPLKRQSETQSAFFELG